MLTRPKWMPNPFGSKRDKVAQDDDDNRFEELVVKDEKGDDDDDDDTLTTGSETPTFIVKEDDGQAPVATRDGDKTTTKWTLKRRKSREVKFHCVCCEVELRPGINCIPTSPKSYTCPSCEGYVCKNCKDQCHECAIKNTLILTPDFLLTLKREALIDYLTQLHYPKSAIDDWRKEYLVKQLLTRYGLHADWEPKPLRRERSSKKPGSDSSSKEPRTKEQPKEKAGQSGQGSVKPGTSKTTGDNKASRQPDKGRGQETAIFYMNPVSASTPVLSDRRQQATTDHAGPSTKSGQERPSGSGQEGSFRRGEKHHKSQRNTKTKSLELDNDDLDQNGAYKDYKLTVSMSELQAAPVPAASGGDMQRQRAKSESLQTGTGEEHRSQAGKSTGDNMLGREVRSLTTIQEVSRESSRKSLKRQSKRFQDKKLEVSEEDVAAKTKEERKRRKSREEQRSHQKLQEQQHQPNVSGSTETTLVESWTYKSTDLSIGSGPKTSRPETPEREARKRSGPRGSIEAAIMALRKVQTPPLSSRKQDLDSSSCSSLADKFDSLKDISCLKDIEELKAKQMKAILKKHGVDVRSLATEQELRYAVIRLWSYKKDKVAGNGHPGEGQDNSHHQGPHEQVPKAVQQPVQQFAPLAPGLNTLGKSDRPTSRPPRDPVDCPKLEAISSIQAIESLDTSTLMAILKYHNFDTRNLDQRHKLVFAVICLWNAFQATDSGPRSHRKSSREPELVSAQKQNHTAEVTGKEVVQAQNGERVNTHHHHPPGGSSSSPRTSKEREGAGRPSEKEGGGPRRTKALEEPALPNLQHPSSGAGPGHSVVQGKVQHMESWLQYQSRGSSNDPRVQRRQQQDWNAYVTSAGLVTRAQVHIVPPYSNDAAVARRDEHLSRQDSISPSIVSFEASIAPKATLTEFQYIDDSFSDISAPLAPKVNPPNGVRAPLASKFRL